MTKIPDMNTLPYTGLAVNLALDGSVCVTTLVRDGSNQASIHNFNMEARDFLKTVMPVVSALSPGYRDGITDVLPAQPFVTCPYCKEEIPATTDDNFNVDHSEIQCPHCEKWTTVIY